MIHMVFNLIYFQILNYLKIIFLLKQIYLFFYVIFYLIFQNNLMFVLIYFVIEII